MLVRYGCVAGYSREDNEKVAKDFASVIYGWERLEEEVGVILQAVELAHGVIPVPQDASLFKLPGILRACIITMALLTSHPSRGYQDFFEGDSFQSIIRNFVRPSNPNIRSKRINRSHANLQTLQVT